MNINKENLSKKFQNQNKLFKICNNIIKPMKKKWNGQLKEMNTKINQYHNYNNKFNN